MFFPRPFTCGCAAHFALGSGARISPLGPKVFFSWLILSVAGSVAAQEDPLDLAREALDKHFTQQALIAKERRNWEIAKSLKEAEIELLQQQIEEIEIKAKEQDSEIGEANSEIEKLRKDNEALQEVTDYQYDQIEALEARARKLLKRLPQSLQEKLSLIASGLPEEGKSREEIKASISDRYVKVLAILKETNRFHSSISFAEEARPVEPGGPEVMTKTLYLGLSQAYYVGIGDFANKAGMGLPGENGWEWSPLNERAPDIQRMIDMAGGVGDAAYMVIPVKVKP